MSALINAGILMNNLYEKTLYKESGTASTTRSFELLKGENMNSVTDLILLIGTNPLPNYLTAAYFTNHSKSLKKIWMICSETNMRIGQQGTRDYANRIKDLLIKTYPERFDNKSFPEIFLKISGDAKAIKRDLKKGFILNEQKGDKPRIYHMNYTGGTKSMAVHTYRFFEQELQDSISFSYLDARNHMLINDHQNAIICKDMRKEIMINIEDLIQLHGFEKIGAQTYQDQGQPLDYYEKIVQEICNNTYSRTNGYWLESYVAETLKSGRTNKGIKGQVLENWEMKKPEWQVRTKFELDVITINGYELCGISCGISKNYGEMKRKGFEIMHRTRQIGGDEVKSVLVTSLNKLKVKKLETELLYETGSLSKQFLVIGLDDLLTSECLWKRLYEYIWE